MPKKDSNAAATKADIAALQRSIEGRFDQIDEKFDKVDERFDKIDERIDNIEEKLSTHDDQFELILKLLSRMQEDLETVQRDVRVIADKLLNDHERRLVSCERRLGLAV